MNTDDRLESVSVCVLRDKDQWQIVSSGKNSGNEREELSVTEHYDPENNLKHTHTHFMWL